MYGMCTAGEAGRPIRCLVHPERWPRCRADGKVSPGPLVAADKARSGRSEAGARIGKPVIPMAVSRQLIVNMLRRTGLEEATASAIATLPDPVDEQDAERFCKENGLLSMGSLVDRMGGSP